MKQTPQVAATLVGSKDEESLAGALPYAACREVGIRNQAGFHSTPKPHAAQAAAHGVQRIGAAIGEVRRRVHWPGHEPHE